MSDLPRLRVMIMEGEHVVGADPEHEPPLTFDQAEDILNCAVGFAASSAREKVLHEALRYVVIAPVPGSITCAQCGSGWSKHGPEDHKPDCIARPDYLTAQERL